MTVYPFSIDGDAELTRVDDNITDIGDTAINQLREAVFAIEEELGIRPAGTAGSVSARLDAFSNMDGTIKASALASIALATLPISNSQVGTNAGIDEFKLNLDHSTSDLYSLGISNQSLLNALTSFANATSSDLNTHIAGGSVTSSGSAARHVASHIDLNVTPSDLRDPLFSWTGLLDKDGVQRSGSTVAEALLNINDDFTSHQNAIADGHNASSIVLNVDEFEEIPQNINDVQKLADHLDDFEVITVGEHRATQHANGIPQIARINGCGLADGYSQILVPSTSAVTYLVTNPNITSVDNISTGDDLVKFSPDNTGFVFDSQFSQVRPGDIIRINYGSGLEATYPVDSIRYVPGSEWVVRLNGANLIDTVDGYASAMIYRPLFDRNTAGILAVASANATPVGSFNNILSSVIVGNPRGAVAVGNGFDANQLDANHYNLWLELYPTGNPTDHVISLPAIDVTGDTGTSPGKYTLKSVVQTTNNALREIGYNYRFIAFEHEKNFGIMLADAISCASFSITSGSLGGGSLTIGSFSNNVIGTAAGTGFDALGLGSNHAAWASPSYASASSFTDSTAAQSPTKVIVPFKKRHYIVDGKKRDKFAPTWMGTEDNNGDYYWDGYISARNQIGSFTVETTYAVNLDLKAAGLSPGKTLVVQPVIDFSDSNYLDVDYGRFIIKQVNFPPECPPECSEGAQTSITVINGIHAAASGVAASSSPELAVRIYFSEDSVGFNNENIINQTPTSNDYHRLHEIFIDNQLKTFSHERARMPIQVETGSRLASSDWHIENVSSKLRGYQDATLDQAKFLRLYILSYDSDSGEYDGYVGRRPSSSASGITSVGPIVRGRKDVPTRFYDETYVDFIDLVFEEDNTTSGSASSILSDGTSGGGGTPRYVDIELFPSLRLNDDMLLLATTEVTWDPQTGKPVVQRVINRRDFGSIDEEDFTESAINFISAGDRHLHENGVIRGYTLDSINPSDNRELFFKGGVALVNGKIITTNNLSVTIPQITENPATTDTVDWGICVNENGFLEPIIITTTKQQFFGRDLLSPNNTYYLPSVTFAELVDSRKDLTPIATVTAAVASVTITDSDVVDIRRNIFESGRFDQLVLSQDGYAGHFNNFVQAINWVNKYYAGNQSHSGITVQVRGTHTLTSSLALSPTVPITFKGEGATIVVNTDQGFIVSDNVTFQDIYFLYNPDSVALGLSSTDYINTGYGCLYHGVGSNSDGLHIKNCNFVSDLTGTRPPFVNIELDAGETLSDFIVEGCTFNDPNSDGYWSAVSVVSLNGGASADPAMIMNSTVSHNKCLQKQGIYLTSTDAAGTLDSPGLGASNVIVEKNSVGIIGYLITSDVNSAVLNSASPGNYRNNGLIISENFAHIICSALFNGQLMSQKVNSDAQISYALGHVQILNNTANWMDFHAADDGVDGSTLHIKSNNLTAYNSNYYDLYYPAAAASEPIAIRTAIWKNEGVGGCIVDGNTIDGYGLDSGSLYLSGIVSFGSCTITNNNVSGFSSVGIAATPILSAEPKDFIINQNIIKRGIESVTAFIFASGTNDDEGIITNNIFDSITVDNSSTLVIIAPSHWIVTRNKNQTVTQYIPGIAFKVQELDGTLYPSGNGISNLFLRGGLGTDEAPGTTPDVQFEASGGGVSSTSWNLLWSLDSLIPHGAYIVSIALSIRKGDTTPSGTAVLRLRNGIDDSALAGTPTWDFSAQSNSSTVTSEIVTGNKAYTSGELITANLDMASFAISGASVPLDLSSLEVVYRW